jgi:hypothetical protein
MLTTEDKEWLRESYRNLVCSELDEISGVLEFSATYNEKENLFLILGGGVENTVGGLRLDGSFKIKIKETPNVITSKLPSLYIEGVEAIVDRHINQTPDDHRACLCSPFVEDNYLTPNFQFRRYFEELVIPFLYGQVFYDHEGRWPWGDLSHGSIGLLESYYNLEDPTKAKECLDKLRQDRSNWEQIKLALYKKNPIKGHTLCFCLKGKNLRSCCHSDAWKGAELLRKDIKTQGLIIP